MTSAMESLITPQWDSEHPLRGPIHTLWAVSGILALGARDACKISNRVVRTTRLRSRTKLEFTQRLIMHSG